MSLLTGNVLFDLFENLVCSFFSVPSFTSGSCGIKAVESWILILFLFSVFTSNINTCSFPSKLQCSVEY